MTQRRRIALLVPSSNTIMENDLHQRLPKDRYTVHTARMYLEDTTAEAERVMLTRDAPAAAELVGTADPDVLVFGCTSAGSLGGLAHDRAVAAELGAAAGCPGIGVLSSITESLQARGMRRIAVFTPYIQELTESVAAGLAEHGREVVCTAGMGISVNVELADPTPEQITDFVLDALPGEEAGSADGIDGIVISCTNFRALEAMPHISARSGLPVVTSNSAVLDAIDRLSA